ncbi:uncharacterized protein LY89DRAFT_735074 [Mollisia scopiformis]|uniref:Phytanoyl-CoA dioxygenase n=1 Tax=Mollisia scopiformis TaxID=149040 RepID=A0A194X804_MOLSC|nr:uncharacterized protein LY89DRAFT_735074 [Mollisia scopiformis]KUJ15932.1 hypothetical protein LY89DRAFT_735074 [Mollisia scopiformis]
MGSISTPPAYDQPLPSGDGILPYALKSSAGSIESSCLAQLKSTSLDTPLEEMKARYERDGYLFVKGVLPPEDVIEARRQYFNYLGPTGLTKEASDPAAGIYCGSDPRLWLAPGKLRTAFGLEGHNPEYVDRMLAVHAAPWYRGFSAHPTIKSFIERLTGWEDSTLLERSILRPNVPGGEATQVHYDQIFLRGGPPTTVTAWVPLGSCTIRGGGLLYLEDSVGIGEKLEKYFAEAAKDFSEEEKISAFNAAMMDTGFLERDAGKFGKEWQRKWLAADYEAGDVVFHHPFIVHASAVNEDEDGRIRLATDLRYVEKGKPFDERWMKIYEPDDGL